MDIAVQEILKTTRKIAKQLQASIALDRSNFGDINRLLAEYRTSCDALIFANFEYACDTNVEVILWDTHSKVNNRYRKQLSYFRDGGGKRKVVEQRKLLKHYLDFIKSSQRYYRGYIQKLASHFGGVPEIEAIAHKFAVDRDSVEDGNSAAVSAEIRQRIFNSCHQTLIRLGDLSRYRETELTKKERNWGPAIGYYDLASAIRPSSGTSHNQLAVIALADSNHLRSTYHLYRALAVEEPHPTAQSNLELEFKKIVTAHEKGELLSNGSQTESKGPEKALLGWFMLLHAQCYKGLDFAGHDELENEVLSQLVIDLKERSLESTLQKFILVNIAAGYFAGVRLQASPESTEARQAFFFFLRFNVKTMFTLLQVLQPELDNLILSGEEQEAGTDSKKPEKITAVARRVLPGLRHYSSWLSSTSALLAAQIGDSTLNVQIKELWKTYANTLTLLAATFSVADLPSIDYLLEEDEDTIGFKPFEDESMPRRYYDQDTGARKPPFHAKGVERQHPNVEMLGRVRDFLTDGLKLALNETIPVDLIDGTTTFAYREEGMPAEPMSSPDGHHTKVFSTNINLNDIPQRKQSVAPNALSIVGDEVSQSASASVSANAIMNEMVNEIVGSEATAESKCHESLAHTAHFQLPRTPPSHSFDESPVKTCGNDTSYGVFGTLTAHEFLNDHVCISPQRQSLHGTPKLLPSILNSVFAPTADDVCSRPGTGKGLSPTRLPLQQQPEAYLVQSSISHMQDPSSMFHDNLPYSAIVNNYSPVRNQNNTVGPHSASRATFSLSQDFHDSTYGKVPRSAGFSGPSPYTP